MAVRSTIGAGIVDAWMQHPGADFLGDPMFDSLRRWKPSAWSEQAQPVEATLRAMDAAGVAVGLLCAWWGPSGPLIGNDEVAKLCAADVASKVVAGWRARAAVEAPSHLRGHPRPLMLTLLAALVHERQREIIDTLADLLISTVHRIGARAERKVTQELVREFRKVAGKETLLFRLAEAAIARPYHTVRAVVYPVAGEKTLRDLVAEYKSSGRPTGAPCRPRCAPPTPGTTGAG